MTDALIRINALSQRFGAIQALDSVSLAIPRGELFGLIGHNGAGKSTLFKTLLGLLPLQQGEVTMDGQPIYGAKFREVRRKIGYLPENVVFYDNLTGIETLAFFARLKGVPEADSARVLGLVGLAHAAQRRVKEYSKGMRQRLGFAQALLGKPQILFLDEPTNGLDPQAIRDFYILLHDLRQQGVTVILTSHILSEIQSRVDRLAILQNGRLAAEGSVQALREQIDLPLSVEVQLRHDGSSLQQDLQAAGYRVYARAQRYLDIECTRPEKMPLLGWLSQHASQIGDIQIKEPTLEDVFMGYTSRRETTHA